jgi:hypothetical protein
MSTYKKALNILRDSDGRRLRRILYTVAANNPAAIVKADAMLPPEFLDVDLGALVRDAKNLSARCAIRTATEVLAGKYPAVPRHLIETIVAAGTPMK